MGDTLAWRSFSYWMRRYRHTWRGTIVISVGNPFLFLLAMGAGLGGLVDQNHSAYLHGVPYLDFFAPGLLAAAAMQTAVTESARPVHTAGQPSGSYRAAAATPLRPQDIFAGHLLFIAFRIAISAAAFVLVMALFGIPGSTLLLVPAALLTGLAFAVPIAAWAVGVDRPAKLNGFFRFVVMPLYMFSGTFFPTSQLPAWLRPVVELSPLWHGVALCRTIALGTGTPYVHVVYLAVLAALGVLAGRRRYRRHLHA